MTPSPTPQRLTPAELLDWAGALEEHDYLPELSRKLRAHAAYLETQEWQPIETAPKDGTPILLATFKNGAVEHIDEGCWEVIDEGWESNIRPYHGWVSNTWPFGDTGPTHWVKVALPKPPEAR